MDNKTKSEQITSYYDILEQADVADMTKELQPGMTGVYLFIEHDVKDLRIISLN